MAGTSMNNNSKDWVVEVEKSLREEPHGSSGEYSYPRVPKFLRNENTKAFYTPQVISFGPYHFQMKEPIFDDEVEVLKSEVARQFDGLLPNGFLAVVENFKSQEKMARIKKIYAKGFPSFLSDDVLALMMTRDACFLVAILNTCSKGQKEEINGRFSKGEKEEINGSSEREIHIPFLSIYHPLLNNIVKDMFKMENRLPLWVLDEISKPLGMSEDDCFESALKKLSPVEVVKKDGNRRQYNPENHILHLLHEYIVDPPEQECPSSSFASPREQTCSSCLPSWGGDGTSTALLHRPSSGLLPTRDESHTWKAVVYVMRCIWSVWKGNTTSMNKNIGSDGEQPGDCGRSTRYIYSATYCDQNSARSYTNTGGQGPGQTLINALSFLCFMLYALNCMYK